MDTPATTPARTVHITKLDILRGEVSAQVDWLARLMMVGVSGPGIISAEIIPPTTIEQTDWALVQRFHNPEQIEDWRNNKSRQKLLEELQPSIDSQEVTLNEATESAYGAVGSVAVAVATRVKPGLESVYLSCEGKFQSAQARRPGYRGVYVQPPTGSTAGTWTTIIRFDSPEALDQWFASDERKQLVDEAAKVVASTDFKSMETSFPGWFSGEAGAEGPPNWKTAMLVLLGLYPIVMLEIRFLMPVLHAVPPALANFIGNSISVALTTWATMPLFISAFKPWLFPTAKTPKWVNAGGILICIALFALEIALLWRLL